MSNEKPPLKWAGGKRWQVPHLRPFWEPHTHRRLVEPFCGGLSVSLGLQPARALLNDVNSHLMNFYRWLQKGLVIEFPMLNERAAFDKCRARFNELSTSGCGESAESAGLFYYLNRTGFNGLCRFNKSGKFNVPFGRFTTINYRTDFSAYRETFKEWTFTCADVESVPLVSDDFVYADPPYDVEFTSYSAGGFGWADQQRTAVALAQHDGPVILVNQATARVEALYRDLGFCIGFLDAPRRISCTGDRAPAKEIIATRNLEAFSFEAEALPPERKTDRSGLLLDEEHEERT